jgi:hypothetical protein
MTEQMKWPEIERRKGLGRDEFIENYIRKNRPVVIEGLNDHWKERWTPQGLKERFGDREVQVETEHLFVNDRVKKRITLADMIDSALAASLEYRVRSVSFLSKVPELQEEYKANNGYEAYFDTGNRPRSTFWISPPGNRSGLHNDTFYENLNVQVYGRKRFILMPPSNYNLMHAHFLSESPVNPLAPDFAKFPRFAKVQIQETILHPGEMLYLPQFWWHYVVALEFAININTFIRASHQSMWQATKPLPIVPKTIYRTLHNERLERILDRSEQRLHKVYVTLFGKKKKKAKAQAATAA